MIIIASFAFINARVEINSVDMSEFVRQVTLKAEVAELDDTAFGDTTHSRIGGLRDWSVDIEFNSDFGASAVDDTLWPLWGTVTTVKVRPDAGSISTTNPEYSGSVLVREVNPMGNSVGDLATVSVSWPCAGPLARATN